MRLFKTNPTHVIIVAIAALFLIAGTGFAASSFLGQGMVSFDSIRVGKNDSKSEIQLQGPLKNPGKYASGKGRPINISDDVTIKGSVTVQNSNLVFSGSTNGWIKAAGSSIVGIDDDLTVTGTSFLDNVDISGALTAGPYNVGTTIASNAALTNRLSGMVSCIGTFAQLSSVIQSSDYIFCFNTWMAGQPGTVSVASQSGLTEVQRAQVEKARAILSADPVENLSNSSPRL